MRNSNIINQQGRGKMPEYDIAALIMEMSEEEAMAFRERVYLMSHAREIKKKYEKYIYEQLIAQNPSIKNYNGGLNLSTTGDQIAVELISENIVLCEECFILYNPKTREPAVITDAYRFCPFYTQHEETNQLMQYIGNSQEKDMSLYHLAAEKSGIAGVKLGVGYALGKGGGYFAGKAGRLEALARHNAAGHSTQMRVNRNFRGKANQRKALQSLLRKSDKYAATALRNRMAGASLQFLSKKITGGILKPITPVDVLYPAKVADSTHGASEKQRMTMLIIEGLDIYCKKNNNYHIIVVNTQSFEPK